MNKRHVFYVGLVLLAALVLFGTPMAAMAAHPDVTTLKADGTAAGATDAYSPKQTCGGCHFNCVDSQPTTTVSLFCTTKKDCTVAGNCPDYESLAVSSVTKQQGILTSSGTISYVTYSVAIPLHGVSTGHHSTEGRNEGLTAAQRTIWAAPSTISSPGMWGRY